LIAKWVEQASGVRGNWGLDLRQLFNRVLALLEQHNLQNDGVLCEVSFGKNRAFPDIRSSHIQTNTSLMVGLP